jgi:hypothetical protein
MKLVVFCKSMLPDHTLVLNDDWLQQVHDCQLFITDSVKQTWLHMIQGAASTVLAQKLVQDTRDGRGPYHCGQAFSHLVLCNLDIQTKR